MKEKDRLARGAPNNEARAQLRRDLVGYIGVQASRNSDSLVEMFPAAYAASDRARAMCVKRVMAFIGSALKMGFSPKSARLVDGAMVGYPRSGLRCCRASRGSTRA